MMRTRVCDKCGKSIPSGEEYVKCIKQGFIDKRLTYKHLGDMCLECWRK